MLTLLKFPGSRPCRVVGLGGGLRWTPSATTGGDHSIPARIPRSPHCGAVNQLKFDLQWRCPRHPSAGMRSARAVLWDIPVGKDWQEVMKSCRPKGDLGSMAGLDHLQLLPHRAHAEARA